MKRTVLVTGGAGYVGSSLVPLLLLEDYNVIVLDNLSFGGESLLHVWSHPHFKFVEGSITSSDSISRVLAEDQFEAVVHLAAIVGDPACAKQPELAERVNWEGSLRLLEASIKNHVDRFVFVSTCSNYGKMGDVNGYVDENSALNPVSLYAELKVKFEKVILNEVEGKNGFCPISLRFATVYGVSPRMRFDLTVNEFTKDLALKKELEVFGEQFWRPYCHVRDVCRAILTVLECNKEKVANNVFNVGDTVENYQKGMIVDEIKKIIPNAKVRYVRKDEDPRDYRVRFSKIAEDLGFKITKRVPDGIKEIKELIDKRILSNPDDARYRNIY